MIETNPRSTLAAVGASMRTLIDADGQRWTVFAVTPSALAYASVSVLVPQYANGWLTFDSPTERRRLAPRPIGWDDLTDSELRTLLGRAEVVSPARRFDLATSLEQFLIERPVAVATPASPPKPTMKETTDALITAARRCAERSPYVVLAFCEEGPGGRGVMCHERCWQSVRRAVKGYAARLRELNVPPERGLDVMRDVLRVACPDLRRTSVLMESAGSWLLEGYHVGG